ncbi:MAG: UDP-4-amino-4,6-dideoxy-N-acetyl-beta-L-altrosamine transaminase [Desulfobacterales bacterium]
MIPYGRHLISQADINAVVAALRSEFITQGPVVPRFEQAIAAYCGTTHAVAVNSATSALHIACRALDLGPGDRAWTSPISFVASANCVRYCGAEIDFVDIDPRTYNMNPDALEQQLVKADRVGHLPKVVIPVHLAGQSCDMQAIHNLSRRYGFRIIEDASHAIGGRYRGEPVGNCRYSDITVFSFHPVKIITTAEGGMALTNDSELARHMSLLRSHGITRNADEMTSAPDGPWYYQQLDLGFNYRLTDLQAALGMSQLGRLDEFVAVRREQAASYEHALRDLPLTLPWQHPDAFSSYHLYPIRLQLDSIRLTHRDVFMGLRAAGIGVNLHYIPIYRQPYYARLGFDPTDFRESERYYAEAISLPLFPGLNIEQQEWVMATLAGIVRS